MLTTLFNAQIMNINSKIPQEIPDGTMNGSNANSLPGFMKTMQILKTHAKSQMWSCMQRP